LKISTSQLRKIIKEEISRVLDEQEEQEAAMLSKEESDKQFDKLISMSRGIKRREGHYYGQIALRRYGGEKFLPYKEALEKILQDPDAVKQTNDIFHDGGEFGRQQAVAARQLSALYSKSPEGSEFKNRVNRFSYDEDIDKVVNRPALEQGFIDAYVKKIPPGR
jgi:hypothetical protein